MAGDYRTQSAHNAGSVWTPERIRTLHACGNRSAKEAAKRLGCSVNAVYHARQRYGRFAPEPSGLCVVCDSRPVWAESKGALRMRCCKGCYLREQERRLEEEQLELRVRQRAFRLRKERGGA